MYATRLYSWALRDGSTSAPRRTEKRYDNEARITIRLPKVAARSSSRRASMAVKPISTVIPHLAAIHTYALVILFDHLRDALDSALAVLHHQPHVTTSKYDEKLPPLLNNFEDLYSRRLCNHINGFSGRPISWTAGTLIFVFERAADKPRGPLSVGNPCDARCEHARECATGRCVLPARR